MNERIRKILEALAKEPSKELPCGSCDCAYNFHSHEEVCALCGGDYRKGGYKHYEDCPVKEAKLILHDHPK